MVPELPAGAATWVALSLAPVAAVSCTAFAKASVVLSAIRVGLGAEALLPWSAVFALSLVVTAVIMGPVGFEAAALYGSGAPLDVGALFAPLSAFLDRHADPAEVEYFASLNAVDLAHPLALVPAFLVTELAEALQMAALILVPFVLVDLVLAQLVALIGLSGQVQPAVALPVKVLLFLAVGGWDAVIRGLVEGYA
jgi:type III secretory pathway component EscR